MANSYQVVTGALTAHASRLSGLSDELDAAAALAGGQNITNDAYGQTCQAFAAMLNGLAKAGVETLQTGMASLETEASELRQVATAYDGQETGEAGTFTTIGGDLR